MKRCFKCGIDMSIDDFYKHPKMADGHLGKCKDCTKYDMRIDRHTKPQVRAYDRERATQPHRVALARQTTKRWRQQYPDRTKAHNAAARSDLLPPSTCEGCGLRKRLEKHHPNYSKPLLVVWFCKPCHAIADKIRRRLEAS